MDGGDIDLLVLVHAFIDDGHVIDECLVVFEVAHVDGGGGSQPGTPNGEGDPTWHIHDVDEKLGSFLCVLLLEGEDVDD